MHNRNCRPSSYERGWSAPKVKCSAATIPRIVRMVLSLTAYLKACGTSALSVDCSLIIANKGLHALPEWLGELQPLERLDIKCTPLTLIPQSMQHLTALQSLSISGCPDFRYEKTPNTLMLLVPDPMLPRYVFLIKDTNSDLRLLKHIFFSSVIINLQQNTCA